MTQSRRIDTTGQANPLANNPFAGLDSAGLPEKPAEPRTPVPVASDAGRRKRSDRGRVDVIRQKAGRGGKTVTVLTGFKGIAARELEELARAIRKASGVGGTLKGSTIEVQGDQRDQAERILKEAGFRPVRAGG